MLKVWVVLGGVDVFRAAVLNLRVSTFWGQMTLSEGSRKTVRKHRYSHYDAPR